MVYLSLVTGSSSKTFYCVATYKFNNKMFDLTILDFKFYRSDFKNRNETQY